MIIPGNDDAIRSIRLITKVIAPEGSGRSVKLIDANKREYLIGKPKKKNPIILELLDSSMHYKLLLLPDLYLGEGYMDGKIVIDPMITHKLPLSDINKGFDLMHAGKSIRAVVEY